MTYVGKWDAMVSSLCVPQRLSGSLPPRQGTLAFRHTPVLWEALAWSGAVFEFAGTSLLPNPRLHFGRIPRSLGGHYTEVYRLVLLACFLLIAIIG